MFFESFKQEIHFLLAEPGMNAQAILKEASIRIRNKYDIYEMTLQVEDYEEEMSDCNQCQNPEA
jgi:zinc transporter 2